MLGKTESMLIFISYAKNQQQVYKSAGFFCYSVRESPSAALGRNHFFWRQKDAQLKGIRMGEK
jgi:hypothetical protein